MRLTSVGGWTGLVAAVACATPPAAGERATVEQLLVLVDSFHVAFAAEDTARLGRLISTDSTMIFYGTSATEIQRGRAAFLAKHQTQDWAQLDSIQFSAPAEVNTQVASDQAVITYHTRLGFVAGAQAGSLPLRITLTLRREGSEWRIVQGNASQVGGA